MTKKTAKTTEKADTVHIKGITEAGETEPAAERSESTVEGTKVKQVVFRTINRHIALEGRSDRGFVLLRARIASMPMGVAALPMPSILAQMFIVIKPFALSSSFLKRRSIIGERSFLIAFIMPLFWATFIIPDQKHIRGAKVSIVVTEFFAPSKAEFMVSSALPVAKAIKSETKIIMGQI